MGGCEPVREWVPVDLGITSLLPTGPTGQAGDLWTSSLAHRSPAPQDYPHRVQKIKSFVYGAVRWVEGASSPTLEV